MLKEELKNRIQQYTDGIAHMQAQYNAVVGKLEEAKSMLAFLEAQETANEEPVAS